MHTSTSCKIFLGKQLMQPLRISLPPSAPPLRKVRNLTERLLTSPCSRKLRRPISKGLEGDCLEPLCATAALTAIPVPYTTRDICFAHLYRLRSRIFIGFAAAFPSRDVIAPNEAPTAKRAPLLRRDLALRLRGRAARGLVSHSSLGRCRAGRLEA